MQADAGNGLLSGSPFFVCLFSKSVHLPPRLIIKISPNYPRLRRSDHSRQFPFCQCTDIFYGAECLKQLGGCLFTNSGYSLELIFYRTLAAHLAMKSDTEAMDLVADASYQKVCGAIEGEVAKVRCRRERKWILRALPALPLRHPAGNAKFLYAFKCGAGADLVAAVYDNQLWQRDIFIN